MASHMIGLLVRLLLLMFVNTNRVLFKLLEITLKLNMVINNLTWWFPRCFLITAKHLHLRLVCFSFSSKYPLVSLSGLYLVWCNHWNGWYYWNWLYCRWGKSLKALLLVVFLWNSYNLVRNNMKDSLKKLLMEEIAIFLIADTNG